jgi:hypothetical protein
VRDVTPGAADCYPCWQGNVSLFAVPVDSEVFATELEECLEKHEGEVAACTVPGENDVLWRDGLVERAGRWVEEGEV